MPYSYDHRLKTAGLKLTQTNVALMASQYAARAFAKGERHGGADLERTFGGALDARVLSAFDILYDWQMWQLTNERQIMKWPDKAVQLMQQARLPRQ